jgi:NADPH-dependent curcumin reductase CurA
MTEPTHAREFHLAGRPHGEPTPESFALVETPLPEVGDGQVLIRNTFLSVDPYMRGRMNAGRSYVPPFEVGRVMEGGAVGEVVESRTEELRPGDVVLSNLGWRDAGVTPGARVRKVDPEGISPSAYLGVLGMPGLTAWVGIVDIASLGEGDTVFVSAAAGAVGGLAGQIARNRGAARVIGSAGSAEKVAYVTEELGFDAAFDYHDGPVAEQLAAAAPDGIDVFFDNVGGEHLEAAIGAMNTFGRIALCGAISVYNATEPPPGPRNLFLMVGKRITARGFIIRDHGDRAPEAWAELGGWLREGRLRFRETVVEGFERMPEALIGLLRGDNVGKMVVKV